MPVLVRADVAGGVGGRTRMAVGVAVETGYAQVGLHAAAIFGGVELRLGKRRHEQPQAFELLGIQDVLEQLIEVVQRHQLAARHIAQVQPRGQVDRRRELRQEVLRQVEIQVEAREVAISLAPGFVDQRLREDHAAGFVMRVRQGKKARRPEVLGLDVFWRPGGEILPGHVLGQLYAHALLHGLAARHRDAWGRAVRKVVALREQRPMAFGKPGFLLLQAFDQSAEVFRGGGTDRRAAEKQPDAKHGRGPRASKSDFHDRSHPG